MGQTRLEKTATDVLLTDRASDELGHVRCARRDLSATVGVVVGDGAAHGMRWPFEWVPALRAAWVFRIVSSSQRRQVT